MVKKALPSFRGYVFIKTALEIEELARIISQEVFNNMPFEGRELNIYDEVPAMFIRDGILGLKFVLSGYPKSVDIGMYNLAVTGKFYKEHYEYYEVSINSYLTELFKEYLKKYPDIEIWEMNGEIFQKA